MAQAAASPARSAVLDSHPAAVGPRILRTASSLPHRARSQAARTCAGETAQPCALRRREVKRSLQERDGVESQAVATSRLAAGWQGARDWARSPAQRAD